DRRARVRPPRRQDRRTRKRLRERGEAARAARRRDRPARRAVGGRRRPRPGRGPCGRGARAGCAAGARARRGLRPRRRRRPRARARRGGGARARARRAARRRGAARAADPQRRRRVRRRHVAGRDGRLRDRREPRPADRRLGPPERRSRPRDVPEAGDGPAADPRRPRPRALDRRGARGGGGHDGARAGGRAMRTLPPTFKAYEWAPSTEELAARAGLDPVEIVRFDGNVPPLPLPSSRPGAIAAALADVNTYPHGGYPRIHEAIAAYAGVEPENVVLGAGGDDLILLVARAFAGPGDTVAIPAEPTYPLYRVAAELAGAAVGDADPVLTFACRPGNPYGDLPPLPDARPLAVDEAYFEYAQETAVPLLDEGVIVIRTFSKAFGLAGARIGYALAGKSVAAELRARQAPAPVSTLSVALALAALASPPDVAPVIEE